MSTASSIKEPIARPSPGAGSTFAYQDGLPKLPIPELADTCRKYLDAVRPLQTDREHQETKAAVREFLKTDGPELHERLKKYANGKSSYIEQFCKCFFLGVVIFFWEVHSLIEDAGYDSYLNYDNREFVIFWLLRGWGFFL